LRTRCPEKQISAKEHQGYCISITLRRFFSTRLPSYFWTHFDCPAIFGLEAPPPEGLGIVMDKKCLMLYVRRIR